MEQYTEAFVGIDTAKNKHALAIADPGRDGEIRYLGEIDSAPAAVQRMIRKLAGRYEKLYFCYEAGPTGYGLSTAVNNSSDEIGSPGSPKPVPSTRIDAGSDQNGGEKGVVIGRARSVRGRYGRIAARHLRPSCRRQRRAERGR